MKLTVRQLKNIIKEAIRDSREGDKPRSKLSDKKADKMLGVLFSLKYEVRQYGKIMPWSRVIEIMEERGIQTSKEEILHMFSNSFQPKDDSLLYGMDSFLWTNKINPDGIQINDPAGI